MASEGSIQAEARRSRARRRATLAAALVLSLLLHLPLVRLVLQLHQAHRAGPEPIDVELLSQPKPAARPEAESDATPGSQPGAIAAGSTSVPPARPKMDLWLRPPKPDLRVRWNSRFDLPPGGPGSLEAGAPPKRSKAHGVRRARAEGRAADQYFADLAKALLRAWDAERALSERGLPDWLSQLGENALLYWRLWRERAESYGRTGQIPLPEATDQRLASIDGLPDRPGREVLRANEASRWMRERSAASSRAAVRVTHRSTGAVLSVELVSPSGDPRVDADAVRDLHEAAGRLPRPPPSVLRGRTRLVSLWELELETSVSPPTPSLALQWDEVSGTRDLRAPLDRRVYKKVRLVGWE